MSTADKIGLLPGFGWVAGHEWWLTLVIVWGLTPLAMLIIAPVFEGRSLPLDPERQFPSFFPGDLLLGLTVMSQLLLARHLPVAERWYNSIWFHVLVLVAAILVASLLTWTERHGYARRALLSPTKLYHNFVLYGGYGYVAVTSLLANIAGRNWTWHYAGYFALSLVPGAIWVKLVVDDMTNPGASARRAKSAHDPDWWPRFLF